MSELKPKKETTFFDIMLLLTKFCKDEANVLMRFWDFCYGMKATIYSILGLYKIEYDTSTNASFTFIIIQTKWSMLLSFSWSLK